MLQTLAELALSVYIAVLPIAQLAFLGALFILAPMAMIPRTRKQAGINMIVASHLFGFTVWMLSAAVTFSTYGLIALLIGMVFFGFGVVPIAIFAGFITLGIPELGLSILGMSIITMVFRYAGIALTASGEAHDQTFTTTTS
jgi:hypothetical protein